MPVTENIYEPVKAKLTNIIDESPLIKTLVLVPEKEFSFKTGEFIELTLNGIGEAPFTPSSSPLVKDKLEITVMKAGYVTGKIHQLNIGDVVGIRGPFGKGYPLEKFYGKEVLIVGGGCGFAPIRSLLYKLIAEKEKFKKVIFCYGSKTPKDCIYKTFFKELRNIEKFQVLRSVDMADEPWDETIGVVTILLDQIKIDINNSLAIVCGPPIMMKFGTIRLLEMGYRETDIYLSMEKNMSCGLGKCGHCMLGDYLVCKDGPVFTYNEIKGLPDIWR
ncbi:MAG: FAD/NAD(P)-binding protein [Bacteroidales bacterium]|jgi:NAD(P)H-flavin reductase|nr:FAD/NAD(P)-binding protein [Bacteroidales bacterium]